MSAEYSPESSDIIAEGWISDLQRFDQEYSTNWTYGSQKFLIAKQLLNLVPEEIVKEFKADLAVKRGSEFLEMTNEDLGAFLDWQNKVWGRAQFSEDVSRFVSRAGFYLSQKRDEVKYKKVLELVDFVLQDTDCAVLKSDVQSFLARDDLTKPFHEPNSPIPYAQHNRQFDLKIGAQNFRCTAVADAAYDFKHSFIIENEKGRKMSPVLQLFPQKTEYGSDFSDFQKIKIRIYEMAVNMVSQFFEILELQAKIHSGKKYGSFDVFGFLLYVAGKGEEGLSGDEVEEFLGDDKNPAAVLALEIDMWTFRAANSGINALEFASMVSDADKARTFPVNKDLFILYCMRGIMAMFKEVFGVASGRIMTKDSERAPWEIPVFGRGDEKSYENRALI